MFIDFSEDVTFEKKFYGSYAMGQTQELVDLFARSSDKMAEVIGYACNWSSIQSAVGALNQAARSLSANVRAGMKRGRLYLIKK